MSIEQKIAQIVKQSTQLHESVNAIDEQEDKIHTVDIDHTGEPDANAKIHDITLKEIYDDLHNPHLTNPGEGLSFHRNYLTHFYNKTANDIHTVSIDHDGKFMQTGKPDFRAKKHHITLKMTGPDTADATGQKKHLRHYLVKHYKSRSDAAFMHPDVFDHVPTPNPRDVHEQVDKIHTVDIDHTGEPDANAKMHNITLKKTGDYSHDASGTKENLRKYLTKHYDSRREAKDMHPEIFEGYRLDEQEDKIHTVDIDHTGEPDANAKMHNITLKKTGDYSHNASGTKANLKKYLVKHYDSKSDAKDMHPEIFEGYTQDTIDVSEDVAALMNGEENLTEEFKTKAATIFEAAVLSRVKAEVAKLEESFDQRLEKEVLEITEGLVEKVDGYLNYVVEQWMKDNEIALENGIKNEMFESFIENMKYVFEQHYVNIPEEKVDVLSEMQSELEEMKAKLDEHLEINVELYSELNEMKREIAIKEYSSNLTAVDAEKFQSLAEELAFDDEESFGEKLKTIKENYFSKKSQKAVVESIVTDQPVITEEFATTKPLDSTMSHYVKAIKAQIK